MRDIHMPVWLGASSVSRAVVFSTLFFMEAFARTVLLAVIPLQALRLMGDAQQVSTVYFVAGLIGVLASLTIPWLVWRIRRRTVLSFGILSMIFSALAARLRGDVGEEAASRVSELVLCMLGYPSAHAHAVAWSPIVLKGFNTQVLPRDPKPRRAATSLV